MSTQELIAMRNRFDAIRRNTRVSDVEMGEALTDAVDGLDELTNLRRIEELGFLADAFASHEEFAAHYTEFFAMAGSC